MWSRRAVVGGLGAAALVGCRSQPDPGEQPLPPVAPAAGGPAPVPPPPAPRSREVAIRAALDWLWTQQSPDGGMRSTVYAVFKEGESLSGFLACAVLGVPRAERDRQPCEALLTFLTTVPRDGAIGFRTPMTDYPVYATSLAIQALVRGKPEGWEPTAQALGAWLRTRQLLEGWEGHVAEGGFGMGARTLRQPPHAGHVDLSMTRRAVEALAALGTPVDAPAMRAAARFVARCQAADGGFIYSPVDPALNKSGPATGDAMKGYGSATTDGILALLALGRAGDDPTLARAHTFLTAIHKPDENPGITMEGMAPYRTAMRGYYQAGAAQVFARLGGPEGWERALEAQVLSAQHADGAWRNDSALQKEDDPLVATGFALLALGALAPAG